jgi:four helix bundle protein
MAKERQSFEQLRVYRLSEMLADESWRIATRWENLARDTVGKQLIRAADRIGANFAEGCGRWSYQDNRRFVRNARGSPYETKHWLRRAFRRKSLTEEQIAAIKPLLDELPPTLNAYLRSIGRHRRDGEEPEEPNDRSPASTPKPMTSDQ